MSELQPDSINARFLAQVSDVGIPKDIVVLIASEDRDLVAYYQLKMTGETDAVDAKRASLIDECEPAQLHAEVARQYGLTGREFNQTLIRIIDKIIQDKIEKEFH